MQASPLPPLSGSPSRRRALSFSCALSLLMLAGCVTAPKSEPPVIARKAKATPLPAAISRIDVKPSTEVLQKAEKWSQTSGALLDGETLK